MSRKKTTTMERLIAKRAAIEAEIVAAEAAENRKSEILSMPEFDAILQMPVHEIRAGLKKMVHESVPHGAESGT